MEQQLILVVRRTMRDIPETEWHWRTEAAAIAAMIAHSGLREKTVALEADIDASTLAKVKQGTARPSEEHLERIMDACGSEAWLYYWLLKRGYDPHSLRKLETETERRLREANERCAKLENDRRVLIEALRGTAA